MIGTSWDFVDRSSDNTGNRFELVLTHIDPTDDITILNAQVFDLIYRRGNLCRGWPAPVVKVSMDAPEHVVSITQSLSLITGKEENGEMVYKEVLTQGITNTKEYKFAQEWRTELSKKVTQLAEGGKGPFKAQVSDSAELSASFRGDFASKVNCSFQSISTKSFDYTCEAGKSAYVYQIEVFTRFYYGQTISGLGGVLIFDTEQPPILETRFPCPYVEKYPSQNCNPNLDCL